MKTNHEIALAILLAFVIVGFLTLAGGYVILAIAWREFTKRDDDSGDVAARPSAGQLFRSALARKCPVCRRGDMFKSRFKMGRSCPVCGAVFFKHEGEWLGPMVIDYSVAVGSALVMWAISLLLDGGQVAQIVAASIAAIGVTVLLAPWSRSFWAVFLYLTGEITPVDNVAGRASQAPGNPH